MPIEARIAPPLGTGLTLAWSVAVTALPVFGHLASQGAGIAICVTLAFLITTFATSALPAALIFSGVFQNLFVSIASPWLSADDINTVRAYTFLLTATSWLILMIVYWRERPSLDRRVCNLMDLTIGVLLLIGVYVVLGFFSNPGGAVIYLRSIGSPILLFQIFLLVAARHRVALNGPLIAIVCAILLYGYLELLAHEQLFALVNGDVYTEARVRPDYESGIWLKEMLKSGRVMRSYLDALLIDFLNTPLFSDLGLRVYRLLGPNFHSISYAYVLAFLSLAMIGLGIWPLALLAIPLLLVVGSKGALVLVFFAAAGFVLVRRIRAPSFFWFFLAGLAVYAVIGIKTGLDMQDYHVIGLVGGWKGFLENPIGRGIGVGGNLAVDMAGIDWEQSQNLGQTSVAVESAIGVLLYQMGVFGFAVLAAYFVVAYRLWRLFLASGDRIFALAAFGILTIEANGLFQEEALFAPLAIGIMLALGGLLLGRSYRVADAHIGHSPQAHPPFRPVLRRASPVRR